MDSFTAHGKPMYLCNDCNPSRGTCSSINQPNFHIFHESSEPAPAILPIEEKPEPKHAKRKSKKRSSEGLF